MSQNKRKILRGLTPASFAITSNDLLSGDAVYFSTEEEWGLDIADAKRFESDSFAQAMAEECNRSFADKIVGAYVIALDEAGYPISNREGLRTTGPSNYFHGKQQVT